MNLGSFLFGKPAKQQNTSVTDQSQFNIGGNQSSSFGVGGSTDVSSRVGQSSQSIAFADLFDKLYGGAFNAASTINPTDISQAGSQLFSGGLQFLQQLNGNAGTDALQARLTDDSALNSQLAALRQSTGDFLTENLLPGVTSRGVATGTLGSSRDAIAQSLAVKQAAGQFSQGAAQLIGTNQAQKDQAAATLAGITGQNAATGLGSLGSLYNLASGSEMAGLAPYQALSAILGGPTTLTESSDIASELANSFNNQGSQSYGFDYGTGTSHSESQGTQTGGTTGYLTGLTQAFGNVFGGGGAASAAKIFSDRRLKKDITRVGMSNGVPVYSFRYRWDADSDPLRFGVMADEVEHIPGAVAYDNNGYALVNYAKVFN